MLNILSRARKQAVELDFRHGLLATRPQRAGTGPPWGGRDASAEPPGNRSNQANSTRARGLAPLAVLALALASCGYVGDPLPPALHIPARIEDLRAAQVGERVVLHFTLPALTTDNIGIRKLAAVELLVGDTPAAVDRLEPGPARAETAVAPHVGRTIECKVRTQSERGRWSEWSPPVTLAVASPVPPPADPRAEPHPAGVRLSWRSGLPVRVWKRRGEDFMEVAEPVTENQWIDRDAAMETPAAYRLQAVAPGGPASEPTASLEITPADIFAPSPPQGLSGVAGINSIELAWERSPEPDTALYRVHRTTERGPDARWTAMGEPSPAAAYSDRDVRSGMTYRYAVSAIDRKGNESAKSASVEVAAP